MAILYNGVERPEHTPDMIEELREDEVFVFGSNLAGMHGGGAAYVAFKKFGAVMWCRTSWTELCDSYYARRGRNDQAIRG